MPYCHFPISLGPPPPPDSGIRNFPQLCHSCHNQAEQLSQIPGHYNVTMWPCLSQLSQLASCHVALHHCTKWITMCNWLKKRQLWQLCLRRRGGFKNDSFSSFPHFSLYPFSVTVVTVDTLSALQCQWRSAAQKVWIILSKPFDNVKTAATIWTWDQELAWFTM